MDTALALRDLSPFLPAGARWLPLAGWLGAALVIGPLAAGAALWVAGAPLRRMRRSGAEVHWTERARLGHPVLAVSAGCGLILPILLSGAPAISRNAFSAVPTVALCAAVLVTLYLSALTVRRPATRGLSELTLTYWQTVRGEWLGLVLLIPQLFVMVAMALTIGSAFDALDAVQSAIGVGAFALTGYSAGIPFVRLLGAARAAEPPLEEIVAEVARRADIRVRRVWVVDWPCVNALALPWSRELVYTRQLLARLDRDEIAALTAHELGHLTEPVSVKLVRSIAAFALLPIGFAGPIIARIGLAGLVGVMAAAFAVLLAVAQVARRMEHRADRVAHAHDPSEGIYARTLEKAYRANGAPAVMPHKRPVHPHLYDRLTAAGVVPDYPRPAAPSRKRAFAGLLLGAVLAGCAIGAVLIVPRAALRYAGDPGRAALWAVFAGDAKAATTLGFLHAADPDPAQAVAWLRLAYALDPRDHDSGGYAATLLAYHGRCNRARELFAEVEVRAAQAGDAEPFWIGDARDALSMCEKIEAAAGWANADMRPSMR